MALGGQRVPAAGRSNKKEGKATLEPPGPHFAIQFRLQAPSNLDTLSCFRGAGTYTAGRPETRTRLFFFSVSMLLQPQ